MRSDNSAKYSMVSSGKQSAMLGFFPLDEGDAPESYGKAQHSIGTVDGVTGTKLAQPYFYANHSQALFLSLLST